MGGVVVAYLKPTNFCSVGCSHCYLPEEVRADRDVMTWETLRSSATMLKDMAERQRADNVHVIFHGGEPLMLKPDWFWEAGEHLDEILGKDGHTESVQTSLLPYKKAFAPWVQERLGYHIGSSVDFSQRTVNGSPDEYLKRWMRKVEMAREDGIYVEPGMVPTKGEVDRADELVKWLADRDFSHFNVDRYNGFGLKFEDRPTNGEHARFLTNLFKEIMRRVEAGERVPVVNVTQAVLGGVLFGNPGDRWGGTCMSDFVVIEPDGSTNNCPDKASFEDPYSNVADGFEDFLKSKSRRKWIRIQSVDHKEGYCHQCENQSWCGSGCPITGNGKRDDEDDCSGYKSHINFVRDFVSSEQGNALALEYLRICQPLPVEEIAS